VHAFADWIHLAAARTTLGGGLGTEACRTDGFARGVCAGVLGSTDLDDSLHRTVACVDRFDITHVEAFLVVPDLCPAAERQHGGSGGPREERAHHSRGIHSGECQLLPCAITKSTAIVNRRGNNVVGRP
jgi:hypothetical protein